MADKPIDVASASGQRASRSRRSQAGQIAQPSTTVRSRDFPREIVGAKVPTPSPQDTLGGALASFFDSQAERFERLDKIEREREDRAAVQEVIARVDADRQGARQALFSGDTTKFLPPKVAERRAVVEAFQAAVAQSMAEEDFTSTFIPALEDADPTTDPDELLEGLIAGNIEGGSPTFKFEYSKALKSHAAPAITEFRKSRVALAQKNAEVQARSLISTDLKTQKVPITAGGYQAALRKVVGMMPHIGTNKVFVAEAILEEEVIKSAAEGHAPSRMLMLMRDPGYKNGTSIADRNPGAFEKAIDEAARRFSTDYSAKAIGQYEDVENRLSFVIAGRPLKPTDSVPALFGEMVKLGQTYGTSGKRWQALRDKINTAMKGLAVTNTALDSVAKGFFPNVSNTDHAKIAPTLRSPEVIAQVARRTQLSEAVVRERFLTYLAKRGAGKGGVEGNSAMLLSGDDSDQVMDLFTHLKNLDARRDVVLDSKKTGHLDDVAYGMYQFMRQSERSGKNPLVERKILLENLRKNDGTLDFRNHYARRKTKPGDANSKEVGHVGLDKAAEKAWDILDLPGQRHYQNIDDVVRGQLRKAVNVASMFGMSNESDVAKFAADYIKGRFALRRTPDGDLEYTIAPDDTLVVKPNGKLGQSAKYDEAFWQRVEDSFDNVQNIHVHQAMGGQGLIFDDLTSSGLGLLATNEVMGFERPITIAPNYQFNIPADQLPPMLQSGKFGKVVVKDGIARFSTPPMPKEGESNLVQITPNYFFWADRQTRTWTLRYAEVPVDPMSLKEFEEKNRAARAEKLRAIEHGPTMTGRIKRPAPKFRQGGVTRTGR